MSDTPMVVEKNCATGETIERPMTAAELAQRVKDQEFFAAKHAEETAKSEALATLKVSAKAKLVAGEPLTTEEAEVLVI
jgi:hypothetical protein